MLNNNTEKKKTIIVPYDFTKVGDNALEYAIFIAKTTEYSICITHILNKDSYLGSINKKLSFISSEISKKHNIKANFIARKGSIFTTINEIAYEISAELAVMGTHGMQGIQKCFGSRALKVIASSDIPYIVIQDKPSSNKFNKVVFPLNYRKEDKEKLNWAYYMAKNYKSKIYVYKAKKTDPALKKGIELNLTYTIKFFEKLNIPYEVYDTDITKDFAKQCIYFAQEIKADIMLIMTTKNITLTDYIFGAHEQYIIANNAKIPVMCVNPKPLSHMGGFSTTG